MNYFRLSTYILTAAIVSGCGGGSKPEREHNEVPLASLAVSATSVEIGTEITFTSTSTDTDGEIASHEWDFGDEASGEGVTATHTFAAAGTYTVTLMAVDASNAFGSATVEIEVLPPAIPVAGFTVENSNVLLAADTLFTDTSSDDNAVVTWAWDFGDSTGVSTEQNPVYAYTAEGVFTVSLTVTDAEGQTDTVTMDVNVSNDTPPIASFSVTNPALVTLVDAANLVFLEEELTFDASASTDTSAIASYNWDFGDGTVLSTTETETHVTATHTYTTPGIYNVQLTVIDDGAFGYQDVMSFQVNAPIAWESAPAGDFEVVSPVISADDTTVFIGGDNLLDGDDKTIFPFFGFETATGTTLPGFPAFVANRNLSTPAINSVGEVLVTPTNKSGETRQGVDMSESLLLAIDPLTGLFNRATEIVGSDGGDPAIGSMAVDDNDDVYINSADNGARVAAVDAAGNVKWTYAGTTDDFLSHPVISADGTRLYTCDKDGVLHALQTNETEPGDGIADVLWTQPVYASAETEGKCNSSLAMLNDGTILAAGRNGPNVDKDDAGFITSITDNGNSATINWTVTTLADGTTNFEEIEYGGIAVGPTVAGVTPMYASTRSGLVALNAATGEHICAFGDFVYEGSVEFRTTPAVADNGNVYIGDADNGIFYVLNPSCELIASLPYQDKYTDGTIIRSSAAIDDSGNVFVGINIHNFGGNDFDDRGVVQKLVLGTSDVLGQSTGPADSSWPMRGQNKRRTGKLPVTP